MSGAQANMRNEIDREILVYVREMQAQAPVTEESIYHFLRDVRRRRILESFVEDRLAYLVDADYLELKQEWIAGEGELVHYRIRALGMDLLDGVVPPRNWKGR